jgi:hypothetical protein
MASAAMLNGIVAHFRLRRHASADDHPAGPVASAAFALAEHTGAGGARCRPWSSVSTSRAGSAARSTRIVRSRLAHHRFTRYGAAAPCTPFRPRQRAHRVALGIAASQPVGIATVRHATKALHRAPRRVPGPHVGALREARLRRQHARPGAARPVQTYSTKCDWRG